MRNEERGRGVSRWDESGLEKTKLKSRTTPTITSHPTSWSRGDHAPASSDKPRHHAQCSHVHIPHGPHVVHGHIGHPTHHGWAAPHHPRHHASSHASHSTHVLGAASEVPSAHSIV